PSPPSSATPPPPRPSTLPLPDALPISTLAMGRVMELRDLMASSRRSLSGADQHVDERRTIARQVGVASATNLAQPLWDPAVAARDRKSTRLNSSHDQISYAVFCLKKKT